MSFYDILKISPTDDDDTVHHAAMICREQLNSSCPKHILKESLDYIDHIELILSSEEGRECYNNIIQCENSYVSPLRALLILKRISWFNVCSKVGFGETFLKRLREISKIDDEDVPELVTSRSRRLQCRWCDKELKHADIRSVVCRCDSRCGHSACLERFMSEHTRCPVCRHKLLRRESLSKYMFFCKDPKYIVR